MQPLFRIGGKTLEVLLGIFLAEEIVKISGQYKMSSRFSGGVGSWKMKVFKWKKVFAEFQV
jgi:hypothetical protein